jgi:hypothetical protein
MTLYEQCPFHPDIINKKKEKSNNHIIIAPVNNSRQLGVLGSVSGSCIKYALFSHDVSNYCLSRFNTNKFKTSFHKSQRISYSTTTKAKPGDDVKILHP